MSIAQIVPIAVLLVILVAVFVVLVMNKKRDIGVVPSEESLAPPTEPNGEPKPLAAELKPRPQLSLVPPKAQPESRDYVRLRKEVIGQDAAIRFAVLKEWLAINMLAILRRACGEWKTASDLIAIVPAYFEPEAEIFNGDVLMIGTRGYPQQLAVPIRDLDAKSDLGQCFEFVTDGEHATNNPAVMLRTNGHFELVSKGTVAYAGLTRIQAVQRQQAQADASWGMECIIVAGFTAKASERVFQQYIQESFSQSGRAN